MQLFRDKQPAVNCDLGGTAPIGGEGSTWRTAVGCAILLIVNNVFSPLFNLEPARQPVFKGAIVAG